jgi:hypothetical protein
MINNSLHVPVSDLGKIIPPSHLAPDDVQLELNDRLAYLNKWDPPSENEWRRAAWMVARELLRGIVRSNWRIFAKLEVLSTRKRPYGH